MHSDSASREDWIKNPFLTGGLFLPLFFAPQAEGDRSDVTDRSHDRSHRNISVCKVLQPRSQDSKPVRVH
jgi:hypothetical protein